MDGMKYEMLPQGGKVESVMQFSLLEGQDEPRKTIHMCSSHENWDIVNKARESVK